MKQLLRLLFMMLMIFRLFPTGGTQTLAAEQKQHQDTGQIHLIPASNTNLQLPFQASFYYINSENTDTETLTESLRFLFFTLPENRIVPRDFCFHQDLSLTIHIRDHEAPVPLFIRGHALLH